MKHCWFHLMPYTELPEDFRDNHESVWVDIDSTLFDPERAHHMYNDFLDEMEYAAEMGFDAVCVNEHHSNGYGLMPSPNLMLASLARRANPETALCVLGNSIALYNPPTRVAEEMAMLDCISGGRLIAGFPVGSPMDTCYAYGQNPSQLRERYAEAHDFIVRAWTESEPFSFNGRFQQQRYVNIWPRPVQQPHPPIWVPGGGSVETWRWCAEMDYVYCYLSYYGYKAAKATMRGFWEEMDRLGKDCNPYRAGFLQFVGVAESESQAREIYQEPAEYFYDRCLRVSARYANPPGYVTEATQRAGVESQIAAAAAGGPDSVDNTSARPGIQKASLIDKNAREMDAIVENGYVIIGSPDQVAEQLREVVHDLRFGQLMLLLQFGNMSKDLANYNTRLYAEKVMPQLADVWSEWENHWWPKPMSLPNRAATNFPKPAMAAE
ncbi:MAG: LLM class flavin-dependent oxidoreductase [Alphaproteobacteria bacterium]|nr:LLM class flavin-dependent oxidoreductase [Alphaproteobacteria bacterium]